jgi:hypothetical protein
MPSRQCGGAVYVRTASSFAEWRMFVDAGCMAATALLGPGVPQARADQAAVTTALVGTPRKDAAPKKELNKA